MPRFIVVLTALLLLAPVSALGQPTTPTGDAPPNIVLIFVDDMGYGDLGVYGHPSIHTPRLDRMAQEGIKLTAFYTAAPVCTPSRAGLLTGRYPIRFGMADNQGPDSPGGLPADERTLAEALKAQGYRTAAFGKWHLGSTPGFFPTDHGFDEYFGLLYSNDMIPPWVQTERPMHLYRNTTPTDEQPVDQTTLTQRYSEEAVRFIRADDDRPFFIYLPHAMPHLPIYASKAFTGRSKGGRYGDVVEELDWSVGRILDVLAEEGLDEETLVIFTSDNGPWRNMPPRMYDTEPVERWDAGTPGALNGTKATTLEGGLRVPALLRWPGRIPAGQVSAEPATTLDLHAMILDLAGASPPEHPLDGTSIWPLLTEQAASPRDYVYYFLGRRLEAVRDARWKLRIAPGTEDPASEEPVAVQLFDLLNDVYERYDVAAAHPDVVARLRAQLVAFAGDTGAELAFTP